MKFVYPPPADGKPFRLTLGLRELSPENWLEFGEDSKNQIRERNELIDTKREVVYQVLEGYDDGIRYFSEALAANLQEFHSDLIGAEFSRSGEEPLLSVGRIICEDLCILKKIEGRWMLVAGLVVFPSRWDLREKIGLDIDQIHHPVPDYQSALQPLLSDTFDKLK